MNYTPNFKGWDHAELTEALKDLLRGYIPKRKKKDETSEFFSADVFDLEHLFGKLAYWAAIEGTDWGEREICCPKEKRKLAYKYTRAFLKALIRSNKHINKEYSPPMKGILKIKDKYVFYCYCRTLANFMWN